MSKKFGSQTTENAERSGDRLGGRRVLDTGVYRNVLVKAAYTGKSQSSNAESITVILDIDGVETSGTFWVTNKEGKNTYKSKTGKDALLGGYDDMDQFSLLTTGVPLNEADFEDKIVKIYNFEKSADEEVSRPTMVDAIGTRITVGITKVLQNKRQKNDDGTYSNLADTYESNEIVKFFQEDTDLTVEEIKSSLSQADFVHRWEEKYGGEVLDKTDKDAGKTGAPRPAGAAPAPKAGGAASSMFKKKS